jgi:hypothetical protein
MLTQNFAANEPHGGSSCDHRTGSTKREHPLNAEVAIEPTALNEGEGQEFGVEASKAEETGATKTKEGTEVITGEKGEREELKNHETFRAGILLALRDVSIALS